MLTVANVSWLAWLAVHLVAWTGSVGVSTAGTGAFFLLGARASWLAC